MAADDRAIVVGINHYPGLRENGESKDLEGPERDAREVTDWLLSPTGGNVPAARVTTIVSGATAEGPTPTEASVDQVFESILDEAKANGSVGGRRLYLFFAGHGFASSTEDVNLLMANATRDRTGHHIAGNKYVEWFKMAALFKEIVLFMDCCREVQQTAPLRPVPWNPKVNPPPSRVFIGYATGFAMASRERPTADNGGEVRGRFTEALVAGLTKAADAQGRVTGLLLKNFVTNALDAEAKAEGENPNNKQTPEFPVGADDDFVLVEGLDQLAAPYQLVVSFAGEVPTLVLGDLMTVVPPTAATADTATWGLRPGLYQVRTAAKVRTVELVGAGGTMHVDF
ncbi:MAG: caspase family protein [Acidobacteriota bacterium]